MKLEPAPLRRRVRQMVKLRHRLAVNGAVRSIPIEPGGAGAGQS
jgi:hypothetical protein